MHEPSHLPSTPRHKSTNRSWNLIPDTRHLGSSAMAALFLPTSTRLDTNTKFPAVFIQLGKTFYARSFPRSIVCAKAKLHF